MLLIAYGLGVLGFFMRWLLGVVALWRILRAARPATPELLQAFHQRVADRRPPRLLISDRLRVPVSCGILRPTVILPTALADAEKAGEREWVFAHELTHVVRRDAWSALLFAAGQMLYFVLPWFWWLRRQVRLCQEYVADAAAAAQRPADEYAEFLLSLTTHPAVPLGATGVSGTKSDLYRRVTMLLQNPVRVETKCPRGWTIAAATVVLGLAVVAAGVGPAQADPPNQKELLEQLDRIQAMLNNLRGQVANPAPSESKKPEPSGVTRVPDPKAAEVDNARRSAVDALQKALRSLDLPEQANQIVEVDQQRALAEKAREQARHRLQVQVGQVELDAKLVKDPKALAQKAEAEKERVMLYGMLVQTYSAAERAKLNAVVDLLQKQMAQMKDGDKANKQLIQEAVDRLKDVLKKLEAAPPMATTPVPVQLFRDSVDALPPPVAYQPAGAGYTAKPRVYYSAEVAGPHGRLGLKLTTPGELLAEQLNLPKGQGLVVAEVFDDSPAKRAGIRINDILLKINNQPVSSNPESLLKMVSDLKADMPFDIVLLRKGKEETIRGIKLPEPQPSRLAVRLRNPAQLMITASRTGNTVTLTRNEGPLMITVQAEIADGKHKIRSINVVEKGQEGKYAKVEEVPEQHRAKVQHLLQLIESTDVRSWPQTLAPLHDGVRVEDVLINPESAAPLRIDRYRNDFLQSVPQPQVVPIEPGSRTPFRLELPSGDGLLQSVAPPKVPPPPAK